MKVTLETPVLQKKLSFVNRGISSRSQLPVLLNFLFEAKGERLVISSTDLEIGIQIQLPAVIEEEGSTTIPARSFSELVQSLSSKTVTIQTSGSSVEVVSSRTKSLFQTISPEEFPKLFEEKGSKVASIDPEAFQGALSGVTFAVSTEMSRPALSGILLRPENEGFLVVATDGYRLSLRKYISPGGGLLQDVKSLIIPARVIREASTMRDEGGNLDVYMLPESNQILFEQGGAVLVGRLIEAEFPNFEKIIPIDHSSKIHVDREELLKAVKITSIFARESANIIKFALKTDRLVVSSQTPSLGENTVDVEGKLTGEENEIAFNARYLLEFLSHVGSDALTFEMTGPLNPGVFRIEGDSSYLHLIMPIRIQQ
jgi:DNA polymerase III subunit beta